MFHRCLVDFNKTVWNKGLNRSGKAAAMNAPCAALPLEKLLGQGKTDRKALMFRIIGRIDVLQEHE